MTAEIIHLFPQAPQINLHDRRARWIAEADFQLIRSAWLWPYGPPGWLGDAWWRYVDANCPVALREPGAVDWSRTWLEFVDGWLRHQPEFRALAEAVA